MAFFRQRTGAAALLLQRTMASPILLSLVFLALALWLVSLALALPYVSSTPSLIFTPKGTSLREPTLFEPFCVKIGRGV